MKTTSLLSIGQLCDHKCTAIFYKRRLITRNAHGEIIIIGHRVPIEDDDYTSGMWIVNLHQHTPPSSILHSVNPIILANTTKTDLAKLYHASLGSPVKSTLFYTIDKGFLNTFQALRKIGKQASAKINPNLQRPHRPRASRPKIYKG